MILWHKGGDACSIEQKTMLKRPEGDVACTYIAPS